MKPAASTVGASRKRPKTGGRKAGTPNKYTGDLRGMILEALDRAGGAEYLTRQADESPAAFMGLVGKTLPKDVNVTANVSLGDLIAQARARIKAK